VWVFSLSSVYERTDIAVDQLPPYQQDKVTQSYSVESLEEAREFIDRLVVVTP
jgi:hypothetical protein